MVVSVSASAICTPDNDILKDRLNARYDIYYYRAEIKRISMDAVIDYAKSLDDGGGVKETGNLESIKEDFESLTKKAKESVNNLDSSEFNSIVKEGVNKVTDFRKEANSLLNKTSEKAGAKKAVDDALKEKGDYLNDLKNTAESNRKGHFLIVFDTKVCLAENRIDRLKKINADTSSLSQIESRLDEIKNKRDNLETAFDKAAEVCESFHFEKCDKSEAKTFIDLLDKITEDFKSLKEDIISLARKTTLDKFTDRINKRTKLLENKLEKRNLINTSEYKNAIDDIKSDIDDIKNYTSSEDYKKVKETLEDTRDKFNGLIKNVVKDIREKREELKKEREEKMNNERIKGRREKREKKETSENKSESTEKKDEEANTSTTDNNKDENSTNED